MNVGLFFGSFNPIHMGHMIMANVILGRSDLDQIWFVVSPQNPYKRDQDLLNEYARLELVQAAAEDNPQLDVTDVEFNLPKPNYTIHTLFKLRDRHEGIEFTLIIGADNLADFSRWKDYQTILKNYRLMVYPRADAKQNEVIVKYPKVEVLDAPLISISATFIRGLAKVGKSIRYLVPDPVERIIREKEFYMK